MNNQKVIWGLAGLCILLVLAGSWARYFGPHAILHSVYMTASTIFVLIPLLSGGLKTSFGRWITAGLVFCWLGDFQIGNSFLIGVFCFLTAHLLFIGSFSVKGIQYKRLWKTFPIVFLVTAAILACIIPNIPQKELVSIILYGSVITVMAAIAFTIPDVPGNRILYYAAALFYISDGFLAFSRFVPSMGYFIYLCHPIYYPACLLFALSVLYHSPKLRETE